MLFTTLSHCKCTNNKSQYLEFNSKRKTSKAFYSFHCMAEPILRNLKLPKITKKKFASLFKMSELMCEYCIQLWRKALARSMVETPFKMGLKYFSVRRFKVEWFKCHRFLITSSIDLSTHNFLDNDSLCDEKGV